MSRLIPSFPGRSLRFLAIGVFVLAFGNIRAQSAEDYLTQANQLVNEGQLREALELLGKATSKYPEDGELRVRFARLLVNTGNPGRAIEMLRPVLALSLDVDTLTCFGDAQTALGDHTAASQAFEAATTLEPNNASLLHRLSQALFFEGKQKESLKAAQRGVETGSPSGEARRFYAFLLSLEGQHNEAYQQQRAALAEDPRNARLLFELSESRRIAGRYSDALEYVELAIDSDPENPVYYAAQAQLFRLLKQEKSAEETQRRADALLSAFEIYTKSVNLAATGDVDKAVELMTPVVEANPAFVTGRLLLADLEARRGHDDQALELYQAAIKQSPVAKEARERSAWIRVKRGDLDAALELLEESAQSSLNSALTRAYFYMSRGRWADAIDEFERVEMRHPLDHRLYKLMSACLREQGKLDEALARLEKARVIRPDDPDIVSSSRAIRFQQASLAVEARQWDRSIRLLRRLVTEDPTSGEYLLRLAFAREGSGDLAGAVSDYRSGLALAEDTPWARKNLAICLTRLGRLREAVPVWRRVCRTEPSAENYLQLGLAEAGLERHGEAEKAFEDALAKGPASPELLYNLGSTKIRLNKVEEGWELVREASRKGYAPARDLLAKATRGR